MFIDNGLFTLYYEHTFIIILLPLFLNVKNLATEFREGMKKKTEKGGWSELECIEQNFQDLFIKEEISKEDLKGCSLRIQVESTNLK